MKTAKLVLGIISIVLSLFVMFQSCAAGIGDAMMGEGGTSGSAGTIVAFLIMCGGIIMIAARKNKGGAIAAMIVYTLAWLIGITMHGIFTDLIVWGWMACIIAAINLISIFTQYKQPKWRQNQHRRDA